MLRVKLRVAAATAAVVTLVGGCSYRVLFWERNIWQDTKGIFTMVEPADLELYRELLPTQFTLPDQPMVGLYVVHFADTEPWPMTVTEYLFPYYEATVLHPPWWRRPAVACRRAPSGSRRRSRPAARPSRRATGPRRRVVRP